MLPLHVQDRHKEKCTSSFSTKIIYSNFKSDFDHHLQPHELDALLEFENYFHEESHFESHYMHLETHTLEDSFVSCLSSLNETEFEFN